MKIALAIILFALFGSLVIGLPAVNIAKADLEVIFSEHFDSSIIDFTRWMVQENTNMSGHLAYGGKVELNNSKITLSSDGSSFPYIKTATDPFCLVEDFVFEFDFTYLGISDFGNGLWLTNGASSVWYNDSAKELETKNIFSLWADNNQSFTRSRISINLLEKEVWNVYVNGWEPNAPTYTFRLEYVDKTYNVFVDNVQVASAQSQFKPNTISFGHPPAIYVPFSTAHLHSLLGGWTSFTIDYLHILQPNTPASLPTQNPTITIAPIQTTTPLTLTPTPTQMPLPTSSTSALPTASYSPKTSPSSYLTQQMISEANQSANNTNNQRYMLTSIILGSLAISVIVSVLYYFITQRKQLR